MTRLTPARDKPLTMTVEHEAQIRAYPYKWHDGSLASHHVVALLAELDAVRAERDEAKSELLKATAWHVESSDAREQRAEQAEATLAAIRALCQEEHAPRNPYDAHVWQFAQRVLALLDAPPSPEKG